MYDVIKFFSKKICFLLLIIICIGIVSYIYIKRNRTVTQNGEPIFINKMISLQTVLDESISDGLRARGLQNPLYDLKNDLLGHPELIPLKGTYGGEMGFVGDYFFVISNHWALVSFSDGHLGGYMLLRYRVNKGKIKWKVLDVDLD